MSDSFLNVYLIEWKVTKFLNIFYFYPVFSKIKVFLKAKTQWLGLIFIFLRPKQILMKPRDDCEPPSLKQLKRYILFCCAIYVLQSITKKHIPLFFHLSFFLYISGTAWATKNLFPSFCTLFWRAFRWNKNLSNQVTKSADICKNVNLPIKC